MIYFDFDGTLVDVWVRYHAAFCLSAGNIDLPLERYIQAKKVHPDDQLLAKFLGITLPADYNAQKRAFIESEALLRADRLLVETHQLLSFFDSHPCQILTSRRVPEAFFSQMDHLGLSELIPKSVVLTPEMRCSKQAYLCAQANSLTVVVGDSEAEAAAAQNPNTRVFLVKTGLRDPSLLAQAAQCTVIDSVQVFMDACISSPHFLQN